MTREEARNVMLDLKEQHINVEIRLALDMAIEALKAQEWIPCSESPKHHNDVLVTGIEAIGNERVYKVMQWDVDRWRPENYAPSITWDAWKEIDPYKAESKDKE